MKVICINAGDVPTSDGTYESISLLTEGSIYTVIEECNVEGDPCYVIEELIELDRLEIGMNDEFYFAGPLGSRLKTRFRPLDTDWIDEVIEKALNEEPELVNA